MNKPLNPPTVEQPRGPYTQAIEVSPNARTLYIAGQGGTTPDLKFKEGLAAQAEQTYRNIVHILEAAGMGPQDLVRMTTFVASDLTGRELMQPLNEARRHVLGDAKPTGATVVVKGFAVPEMLIEIDAIACKAP